MALVDCSDFTGNEISTMALQTFCLPQGGIPTCQALTFCDPIIPSVWNKKEVWSWVFWTDSCPSLCSISPFFLSLGKSQQPEDPVGRVPRRYGTGELAWSWNAKGWAHPTFLIDCASGKPLSLPGPCPPPPERPHLGLIPPHMETYILFCWDLPRPPQEVDQRGEVMAEPGKQLSKDTQDMTPKPVRQPKSQEGPKSKATPSKSFLPTRPWDTVKDSLKAFCFCICGPEN
ncbi:steroid receptor-associated and regulated protein [Petaurus breviceps papuanus]|uniref:steroid receptor-associated and regulated protein n=1 Tax=Petaurus breviceps papuanus TaxID=3040969 RepID=UPI0036D86B37